MLPIILAWLYLACLTREVSSGSVDKPALTTIHSVTLAGLTPGALYNYTITSKEFYNHYNSSSQYSGSFTTPYSRDDITARDSNGTQWVGLSTGSSFSTPTGWTTWNSSINWTNVLTGDFNGDGKTDIAAFDPATGNWYVAISNGSSFSTPTVWTTWSTGTSSNPTTWVDVQVGDFNGDGKADIIGRWLQGGTLWIASSLTPPFWTLGFWNIQGPTWSTGTTWQNVLVGDFNGDGKSDLAGRANDGTWWVSLFNGIDSSAPYNFVTTTSPWVVWSTYATWVDVKVGDFNGDGKADIVGRYLQGGQWWTAISTGSSFNSALWDTWSTGVTWVDAQVGDFNGDGKADITARTPQTGQWWVGISNGSNFSTTLWVTWSTSVSWVDVQVGDFNGDGKADITGRALYNGPNGYAWYWWVALSTGSSFNNGTWAVWSSALTYSDGRKGEFDFPF